MRLSTTRIVAVVLALTGQVLTELPAATAKQPTPPPEVNVIPAPSPDQAAPSPEGTGATATQSDTSGTITGLSHDPISPATDLYATVPAPAHDPFITGWAPNDEWCRYTRVYRSIFLGRLWFSGEYLGWDLSGQQAPPLVTTSSLGTAQADAGIIGRSDTRVLFGDEELHNEMRSGGRMTLGYWWTPEHLRGIQASYFAVDGLDYEFRASGTGDTILARPFVDAGTGQAAADLIAFPNLLTGTVNLEADTEFSGAELLLRRLMYSSQTMRVDLVAGYRYTRLFDHILSNEVLFSLDNASGFTAGSTVQRFDLFDSESEFHGGQLGLISDWWYNEYIGLQLVGKTALGATRAALDVNGATRVTTGGTTTTTAGGVLTADSNIGTHEITETAVVSELGISMICQLTCNLRGSFGYTLLYWSDVARAGEQIDTLVGGSRPQVDLELTDFWAQGLNLGLEYQF